MFKYEVSENNTIVKAKIPVNIRLLSKSKEDIDRLTEFWPPDTYVPPFSTPEMIRNLITERLDAGEACFIGESNGEIICMSWLGFYNAHIFEPYEKKRGLSPGEALGHSAYCAAKYRGNNVISAVRSQVNSYLNNNNYKTLINYVAPDNTAPIKMNTRFGGKQIKTLHSLKILWFQIYFMRK